MLTRLNMLILMQPDLQKAVDFYTKLGGLELKFHMKKRWAEFELGSLKVGLCPTESAAQERRTGIVFEIESIQEFYDANKQDLDFIGAPLEKLHGVMVSVKDPGGNIIDLYQPTPEKLKKLIDTVKQDECCQSGNATPCCSKEKVCQN